MLLQLYSPPPARCCTFNGCRTPAIVHVRIEKMLATCPQPLNALLCPAHFLIWAAEFETWELEPHPTAFAPEEVGAV